MAPVAFGGQQFSKIFLGAQEVSSAYLGTELIFSAVPPFEGGNADYRSLLTMVRAMRTADDTSGPTAGGTLTINSESLGSYDYCVKKGNQTVSSFSASDWFSSTQDSRAAFVVVDGNLTINSGQTIIPGVRKLFTVIYVTGDLTVNGGISMSQRGANHSPAGSNLTAAAIRIAAGTHGAVTNPQIPAAGANGGSSLVITSSGWSPGNDGAAGLNGATGGGASGGARRTGGTITGGAGTAGTAFGGGTGGGAGQGSATTTGLPGTGNGGEGGAGATTNSTSAAGGGAGNPGGTGISMGTGVGASGGDGTGGVLIIFVEGNYSGSGSVTAAGANGGNSNSDGGSGERRSAGGGASGGGSVTIMVGGTDSGPTPSALGGIGGQATGTSMDLASDGGNGGDGSARVLELSSEDGPGEDTLETITFVTSDSYNAGSFNLPATVQQGDLMVVWDCPMNIGNTVSSFTNATGWTPIVKSAVYDGAVSHHMIMYGKIAESSDAGASVSGATGTSWSRKALAVFRGNVAISNFSVHDPKTDLANRTTRTETTQASTGGKPSVVMMGWMAEFNLSSGDRTSSPTADGTQNIGSNWNWLGWKIFNVADTAVDTSVTTNRPGGIGPSDLTIGTQAVTLELS